MRTIRGMFITTAMLTLSAVSALAVGTPGQTGGLTLSVQCAPDPAYIGQIVNCFISVSPDNDGDPIPTGTVYATTDGAATQASQVVDASGNATFSLTGLHAGDNTITVTYPGDGGPGNVVYNYGVNVTGSYTFTVLVPPTAGNGPVMFIGAGYRLIPPPAATTQASPWYPTTDSYTGTQQTFSPANVWSRNSALYATLPGSYDSAVGEDYYSDCTWAGFGNGVIPASVLSVTWANSASAYGIVYAGISASFDGGVTWSQVWPQSGIYYIGENGKTTSSVSTLNVPAGTELSRVRVHANATPSLSGQNNASLLIYDIHIQ